MAWDNELPHPLPREFGTEILRSHVGSGVNGITVPGPSDRDEMGICIEPMDCVIGLDHFEEWRYRTQPDGVRSGEGDLDLTVYSLRKWMRLACQGNPTVLTPLFTPVDELVTCSHLGAALRLSSDMVLSRQSASRFLGYMTAQRERMLGLRGGRHTNRPELVEQYGFDTKFAYHMIRLGVQGEELLTTGRITMPMPEPWRTELIELRMGKWTMAEALACATELEERLAYLKDEADLPEQPDMHRVNRWLIEAYQDQWSI